MSERWFTEFRLAWIKESVEIFGHIRREHIMRKFGISMPQASTDIAATLERWPGLMDYNKSAKQYERCVMIKTLSEELREDADTYHDPRADDNDCWNVTAALERKAAEEIERLREVIASRERALGFVEISSAAEQVEGRILQLNEEDCKKLDLDFTWEGAYKRISAPDVSQEALSDTCPQCGESTDMPIGAYHRCAAKTGEQL